jgi:predicted Zn-ribbon and HTH transcriptional regulator
MAKIMFVPQICKCIRCGYQWISRVEKPKACPNCHSYRWGEEEKEAK